MIERNRRQCWDCESTFFSQNKLQKRTQGWKIFSLTHFKSKTDLNLSKIKCSFTGKFLKMIALPFLRLKKLPILILLAVLYAFGATHFTYAQVNQDPVDYVNPYMGNISHLLVPTYPTIHLPNSMLRVYPQRDDYTGVLLKGLPLAVTSHRGKSAFNFSPFQQGGKDIQPVIDYTYDQEQLTPYSYSVYLDEEEMQVSYGLSHQAARYKVDFGKTGQVSLIFNSENGGMSFDGEGVKGFQQLANNTRIYIYILPDTAPEKISILKEGQLRSGNSTDGNNAAIVLQYPKNTASLSFSYGISFIDAEQAKANLEREVKGKSLSQLHSEGRKIWNETLGKLAVEGGSLNERTVFYTSLYRTFERPVNITEDGRYFSAFDGSVHETDRDFYTDDWIWDSYRAHHPLNVLIEPKKEEDILNSFITMATQMENFWLPTFPEITGDSRRMNSNHGVATLLDAYRKGLRNFDLEKAYLASKNAITEKTLAPWSGLPAGALDDFYKEHGYIPALHEGEAETIPEVHNFERRQAVAVTLGTAYDQWALAGLAEELGKEKEARFFYGKSFNYRNLFNPETDFFHPKDSEGAFILPFDYKFAGGQGARAYYGENNAYTYQWDVQHNIADLIDLMGGREAFTENLNTLFTEPLGRSKYDFYEQLPDQTGNVGQFSMANEPSLHIPYLYNYVGQPWKTQKTIRTLVNTWFRNDLMGVPGDEDGGGMSAFVVFSQMGFYPVTPGSPTYNIGSPFFEKAAVHLENGKTFTVTAKNYAPENKYIQSAQLNGKALERPWFHHDDLKNGGELILQMGPKANKNWGSAAEDAPPSAGASVEEVLNNR